YPVSSLSCGQATASSLSCTPTRPASSLPERRNRAPWAEMTHFFTNNGLPLLFAVVLIESFGIPVPGETALIAFGVLAAQGHYSIASVIAIAAAGAIVGD